MSESWAVQFVSGVHHFLSESGCRIPHERDVIAQFHGEPTCGFNACIRQKADDDHVCHALLFELEVEIVVSKAALPPVFLNDDVAFLRHKVGMPFTTPRSAANVWRCCSRR
jgi:hypothetical protein